MGWGLVVSNGSNILKWKQITTPADVAGPIMGCF